MSSRTDQWTPYGLEALRQRIIWRRRIMAVLLAIVLAGAGFLLFTQSLQSRVTISTGGGGGSTVTIDVPEESPDTGPDATVGLQPGRVNYQPSPLTVGDDGDSGPSRNPQTSRAAPAQPIPYMLYLWKYGPPVLGLLLGLALLGRTRSKGIDEVNFGVYKGAMPLEAVTARYSHLVETKRTTYENPFGKRRDDYIPLTARTAPDPPDDGPRNPNR